MNPAVRAGEKFRFGPYEANTRTRELRNRGLRIKLRDKPFEMLVALLERPGEVVTREELRHRLWPEGTFVEFENGLDSAMNRLRSALRDSTGKTTYVETLRRVGYRFIAPVEHVPVVPPRIAVLPFDSIGPDADNEFLSDAVTDALITELGNIKALRVISRQSVLHLKGTRRTAPEIARELKVDVIVEGSVMHSAGRARTTAQLIQAEPEQHLWAKAYEYEVADLLTTQGRVAKAIAEAIQVAITAGEVARLGRPRPMDSQAHVAYLKGRHHLGQWSGDNLKKALEYLQSAIEKDPGHALAHAHIADCYAALGFWGVVPFQEAFRRAKDAAHKALALDGGLSAAHWASAWCAWFYDWDLTTCEAETRRALELNPSDEIAHANYSFFLATTRDDRARALDEIRLALDLDPLSMRVNFTAMSIYLFVDDFEQAVEQSRKNLELFPQSLNSFNTLGLAELCRRKYTEAIAALERAASISPDPFSLAYLGSALARAGQQERAREVLQQLLNRYEREHVAPRCFALLYTSLGEQDCAFAWLERAFEARDPGLFALRVMPLYDPLRSDPRFERILERVGIGGVHNSIG